MDMNFLQLRRPEQLAAAAPPTACGVFRDPSFSDVFHRAYLSCVSPPNLLPTMPRRTVGKSSDKKDTETFDFLPMVQVGITMLKFGRSGKPHERLFKLSEDLRFLKWYSGWFTSKVGMKSIGKSEDSTPELSLFLSKTNAHLLSLCPSSPTTT